MAPILKLPDDFQWNGVAECDVGRSRIHSELDAQRPSRCEPFRELFGADDALAAALKELDLLIDGRVHGRRDCEASNVACRTDSYSI